MGRLSILIFHRVLPATDPLLPDVPDAVEFERLLHWIKSWFNVVPLVDAITQLREGRLPERAVAITFDDGYSDNYDVALPLLVQNGMSATFFIATGYLDGGLMWNDAIIEGVCLSRGPRLELGELGFGVHDVTTIAARRLTASTLISQVKYLAPEERSSTARSIANMAEVPMPHNLMMSSLNLRSMRKMGMAIGAHTVWHPILAKLDTHEAREEISASKRMLEGILQEPVKLFAYPNGKPGDDYLPVHTRMVRELAFDAAVSTSPGVADAGTDVMQLPRFTPWDRTRPRFGLRLAANLRNVVHH